MALKHVKEYFLECQNQYIELLTDIKDFEEGKEQGIISEEQVIQAKKMFENVKSNYLRLSYIMFLFNIPKNKKKRTKFEKESQNKKLFNYFQGVNADKECIINENKDVLKLIKLSLKDLDKRKENDHG